MSSPSKSKRSHRENRNRQAAGHLGREEWRSLPATEVQKRALRVLAMETGVTFRSTITRGQAWRRIREATDLISDGCRSRSAPPWWSPPGSHGVKQKSC